MSSSLALRQPRTLWTEHDREDTPQYFMQQVRQSIGLPYIGEQPAVVLVTYFLDGKAIAHLAAKVSDSDVDRVSQQRLIAQAHGAAEGYVAPHDRVDAIKVSFLSALDQNGNPKGILDGSDTRSYNSALRESAGVAAVGIRRGPGQPAE